MARAECCACDRASTGEIIVNGKLAPVCNRHTAMSLDNEARFLAHLKSKNDFLNRHPKRPSAEAVEF